jgi:hypothetical protein
MVTQSMKNVHAIKEPCADCLNLDAAILAAAEAAAEACSDAMEALAATEDAVSNGAQEVRQQANLRGE